MEFQINYLLLIQSLRDNYCAALIPLFCFITKFGQYLAVNLAGAFVYWIIDKKRGAFVVLNGAIALAFCHFLKNIVCISRPWILDSRINPVQSALKFANGYSFPSGHTTIAVACWGAIAKIWKNNKVLQYSMILLCILVALSRNFLGVHTLQDVVVAAIVGIIILHYGYKIYLNSLKSKYGDIRLSLCALMLGLGVLIYSYYKTILDASCIPCFQCGFDCFGFLCGAFIGWILERRFINFEFKNLTVLNKIVIYLVGALLLIVLMCFTRDYFLKFFGDNLGSGLHSFSYAFYILFLYPLLVKITLKIK